MWKHGTTTGYRHGCRCQACGDARREYAQRTREQRREWERRYREQNAEKCREANRRWRKKYPGRDADHNRRWREANPEKVREKRRLMLADPEYKRQAAIRAKAWLKTERGKLAQRRGELARQARERDAAGRSSVEQLRARIDYYGGKCWMCGASWEHLDHVIPLARGGSNWPANLRPACGPCNRRKHAKKPSELSA